MKMKHIERDKTIDLTKAICIILMIVGHCDDLPLIFLLALIIGTLLLCVASIYKEAHNYKY